MGMGRPGTGHNNEERRGRGGHGDAGERERELIRWPALRISRIDGAPESRRKGVLCRCTETSEATFGEESALFRRRTRARVVVGAAEAQHRRWRRTTPAAPRASLTHFPCWSRSASAISAQGDDDAAPSLPLLTGTISTLGLRVGGASKLCGFRDGRDCALQILHTLPWFVGEYRRYACLY